jgi:GMP synthase-like glutamine amidotransferase
MIDPIRIHCFMHVPFEGPGIIENWAHDKGHQMDYTRFYEKESLPEISEVELLVIMGGPMNAFDYQIHPWMEEEIAWVKRYMDAGKPLIGICLGAQIIAAALGVDVYPGKHKEIGWHNLQFLPSLGEFRIFGNLPDTRKVFHWHGDTFPIPAGALRIASSEAFPNQAFIHNKRTIALQFHLEVTLESVTGMVDNCRNELESGPYIQSEEEILKGAGFYDSNQPLMFRFLDYLSGLIS